MTHLRAAQAMTDRLARSLTSSTLEGPRVSIHYFRSLSFFFFSRMACQTSCFTHLFLFSFLFVCFLLVPFWFHCSLLLRAILCAVRHGPWSLWMQSTSIPYIQCPPPSYLQQTYLLIALTLTLNRIHPRILYPPPSTTPTAPTPHFASPSQRRPGMRCAHHQIINCTICPTSIHTPFYTQPLLAPTHYFRTAYEFANVPDTVRYTHGPAGRMTPCACMSDDEARSESAVNLS